MPEEHKELDDKPVCDKRFKENQELRKKTQCINLTTKEGQPFCKWLQSFLADPKQCSSNCDGWELSNVD